MRFRKSCVHAITAGSLGEWQGAPAALFGGDPVELSSTAVPLTDPSTTIKSPVLDLTNQRPCDPCEDSFSPRSTRILSPIYSNPDVDCAKENMMRAQQLALYYIF